MLGYRQVRVSITPVFGLICRQRSVDKRVFRVWPERLDPKEMNSDANSDKD
jgi:hypothetical protein